MAKDRTRHARRRNQEHVGDAVVDFAEMCGRLTDEHD